jgi:TPR repeat protein
MMNLHRREVSFILLAFMSVVRLSAGDGPKSVALKDHALRTGVIDYGRDRSGEELIDIFHLVQDANSGNPVAQHQLGLRYLLGKGFTADTAKAAAWIGRAAGQNLLPARYNYGILLNNGWGVAWNPFEAFRNFAYAARHGMQEAQYVFGLLYTDNLAVQRDYAESYRWIRMAADSGYVPARDILADFEKSGLLARIRPADSGATDGAARRAGHPPGGVTHVLPLPDFMGDTIRMPDDTTLVLEALRQIAGRGDSLVQVSLQDTTARREMLAAAEAGSPEALTLVGRWYETGEGVLPDRILAAVYYLRAIRFDSPRAPVLLDSLIRSEGFFGELKSRVEGGEQRALYAWSGLLATGFDRQITESQALTFLRAAATDEFPEAIVSLAMCYYDGKWVRKDRHAARDLLERGLMNGSREAGIRLLMLDIMQDTTSGLSGDVRALLGQAANEGSILAESMLGYCYQYGKGGDVNIPGAVKYYRRAARRGSIVAFNALREMYDERRPPGEIFRIHESEEEMIGR